MTSNIYIFFGFILVMMVFIVIVNIRRVYRGYKKREIDVGFYWPIIIKEKKNPKMYRSSMIVFSVLIIILIWLLFSALTTLWDNQELIYNFHLFTKDKDISHFK